MKQVIHRMLTELKTLDFGPPVTYVYNPLDYAKKGHDLYWRRYGTPPKKTVLVGMNPGPWGMAQTGVPFGEISAVKNWLGIEAEIHTPENCHPKRPIEGFFCPKSEVSGRRFWGWAERRFGKPEQFFFDFFVINYCPLMFLEETGRNRTPDKLPKAEKKRLFEICDTVLRAWVAYLAPDLVIGVGKFAETRALTALGDYQGKIGRITHPSPANPLANKGWEERIEAEMAKMDCL